jgi:hypothetical protein
MAPDMPGNRRGHHRLSLAEVAVRYYKLWPD